ncbi:MAG: hypothetical protein CMJ67_02420 [Planctomycetaceae bacterium]|nr:hypothetical protein [Planctomycetaceae bacterium]
MSPTPSASGDFAGELVRRIRMPQPRRRAARGPSNIGVEIDSDRTRVVQPRRPGSEEIRRAVEVPHANGGVDVTALRNALRGFAGRNAVVSPPPGLLELRPVRLPRLVGEELREAARWEAASVLEVEGADLVAEPIVVSGHPGEDGRLEMLVIAGHSSQIVNVLEPVFEAGLRPIAVEPGFLAGARVFTRRSRRDAERNEVRLVIEVGIDTSWLVVMQGDAVVFAKSVEVGASDIHREISRDLGISESEANSTRIDAVEERLDGLVLEAVRDCVRRSTRPIVEEASMALRYATVSARLGRARAIHVTGFAGRSPGLAQALDAAFPGVPLEVDHVLDAHLEANPTINQSGGAPTWSRAYGLAIRPLVPMEIAV